MHVRESDTESVQVDWKRRRYSLHHPLLVEVPGSWGSNRTGRADVSGAGRDSVFCRSIGLDIVVEKNVERSVELLVGFVTHRSDFW